MTKEQCLKENKDFFEDMKGDKDFAPTPKKERAWFVYTLKQQYPAVSVSVLCHAFDVYESVFRTERLINIDDWKEKSLNHIENDIFDSLMYTKDQRIEDLKDSFPALDYTPILKLISSS
jgi:hypothetical protein